ncbi:hypothetical protein [Sphingomonas sp.]|uniref:hypothetical protein n=1 Tax=Sphingomonas sp. TaxID=28214 RepID=UPI003AFFB283
MKRALLFVGESHVAAIRDAAKVRREADPGAPRTRSIYTRDPRLAPDLTEGAPPRFGPLLEAEIRDQVALHDPLVASVIGGNVHNALALLRHERPFDFHLSGEPSPPLDPAAERVPEALVAEALRAGQAADRARLTALHAVVGAFVHVESVPPLRDDRLIAAAADRYFVERGITARGVAPASLRYRMWRLASRLMRREVEGLGCAWLPVPRAALDADGFLRPELAGDATHGNGDYAELLIRALERP